MSAKPSEDEEDYICHLMEMLLPLSSPIPGTFMKKCDHGSVKVLRKCRVSHHCVRRAPETDRCFEILLRLCFPMTIVSISLLRMVDLFLAQRPRVPVQMVWISVLQNIQQVCINRQKVWSSRCYGFRVISDKKFTALWQLLCFVSGTKNCPGFCWGF